MNFPYGEIVTELPEGFVPPEMWPEYAYAQSANIPPICAEEIVGTDPTGVRWSLWPLCIEEYLSDKEPNLEQSKIGHLARNRIVRWNRFTNTDIPPGWRIFSKKPWRVDGFHIFEPNEDYKKGWSRIAKRYLRTWNAEYATQYRIENISLEEFISAYKKSTVIKKAGSEGLRMFQKKYAFPHVLPTTVLWGVRNITTGEIIAGTGAHYSPTYFNNTVHICPFMNSEGGRVRAMTALIDHWFAESAKRGSKILFMTYFWYPGKPKNWKGFSEFKSHFGLKYIAYPGQLGRFVRGTLF